MGENGSAFFIASLSASLMDAYVARQGKDMAREGMVGESNPCTSVRGCVVRVHFCPSSNHRRAYAAAGLVLSAAGSTESARELKRDGGKWIRVLHRIHVSLKAPSWMHT